MLEYHAAYYVIEDGWFMGKVLDFPGAISQGRTLKSARHMIRDALRGLADFIIEKGEVLPRPNPRASDKKAVLVEKLQLTFRCEGGVANEKKKAAPAPSRKRVRLRAEATGEAHSRVAGACMSRLQLSISEDGL
jgi:predicted RNase H-like HicB family nuclease